jgi:hypothetical protein
MRCENKGLSPGGKHDPAINVGRKSHYYLTSIIVQRKGSRYQTFWIRTTNDGNNSNNDNMG